MKKLAVLALFFASSFTFGALAMSPLPSGESELPSPILNFSQVTPRVFRGARPNSEGLKYLAQIGVRSIVNLQGGDLQSLIPSWIVGQLEPGELSENIAAEKAEANHLYMTFHATPLSSLQEVTPEEDKSIDEALEFIANPANQPVFIHCEHGKDRTGMLIALYEVKYLGMPIEAAHDEMIAHGHGPLNQIFTHSMDDYFYKKAQALLNQ